MQTFSIKIYPKEIFFLELRTQKFLWLHISKNFFFQHFILFLFSVLCCSLVCFYLFKNIMAFNLKCLVIFNLVLSNYFPCYLINEQINLIFSQSLNLLPLNNALKMVCYHFCEIFHIIFPFVVCYEWNLS